MTKFTQGLLPGGCSTSNTTYAEKFATMIRLNLVKGLEPVRQIAEG